MPGETAHVIREGDARDLSFIESASVHLICTSPPYGSLVEYPQRAGQLGNMPDYDDFLGELDKVWAEALRILVPGGRVACVVGDVCISRRQGGRHYVLPLSADIQVRARKLRALLRAGLDRRDRAAAPGPPGAVSGRDPPPVDSDVLVRR